LASVNKHRRCHFRTRARVWL